MCQRLSLLLHTRNVFIRTIVTLLLIASFSSANAQLDFGNYNSTEINSLTGGDFSGIMTNFESFEFLLNSISVTLGGDFIDYTTVIDDATITLEFLGTFPVTEIGSNFLRFDLGVNVSAITQQSFQIFISVGPNQIEIIDNGLINLLFDPFLDVDAAVSVSGAVANLSLPITVAYTQFNFEVEPPASVNTFTTLSPAPLVTATDVNGNIDLDYNEPAIVDNFGGLIMSGVPTSWTNGQLLLDNLQYETEGDGTLDIIDNFGVAAPVMSTNVNVLSNDVTPPTASIFLESINPNDQPVANFRVLFDEPVFNVGSADFALFETDLKFPAIIDFVIQNAPSDYSVFVLGIDLNDFAPQGTLTLGLDVGTDIQDLSGNFADTFSPTQEIFTIISPEPAEGPTGLVALNETTTTIDLQWSNSVVDQKAYQHVLLVRSSGNPFPSVIDGTEIVDDFDFSDGVGAINIPHGVESYQVTGLLPGTAYDFELYAYTNLLFDINYNLSPAFVSSATFTDQGGQLIFNYTAPLNSTSDVFSGEEVLNFDIVHAGGGGGGAIRFEEMRFIVNTSSGYALSQFLQGAELTELTSGNFVNNAIFNGNEIVFSGIPAGNSQDIGRILQVTTKTYSLRLVMSPTPSVLVDNETLDYYIDGNSFIYISNLQIPPTSSIAQSNQLFVDYTQFNVDVNPPTSAEIFNPVVPAPLFSATDINGNIDEDYNEPAIITSPGGLVMSGLPGSWTNGQLLLDNYQYEGTGDGALSVADNLGFASSVTTGFVDVIDPCAGITIDILKIADNTNCEPGVSGIDTGELRAVVRENGVEVTDLSPYSFQWFEGTDTLGPFLSAPQGGNSSIAIGLVGGDYTVEVTNLNNGCVFTPVTLGIVDLSSTPVASIRVNSDQTDCSVFNGELQVLMADFTGVTFDWRDQFANSMGIIGPIASDLVQGNYTVIVEKDGCTLELPASINGPILPDITAAVTQDIVSCINPNTGEVMASVNVSGVPQDPINYNFEWYFYDDGSATLGSLLPPENGIGPDRTGLPLGDYAVYATDISTNCATPAAAIVTIIDNPEPIIIPDASIIYQTACDPAVGGGSITVNSITPLSGGSITLEYTFEWYETALGGTFASAQPRVEVGSSISNLPEGTYYVVATRGAGFNPGEGCASDPFRVDVFDNSVTPTFNVTSSPDTSCSGSGEGSIVIDNFIGVGPYDIEVLDGGSNVVSSATNHNPAGAYVASGLVSGDYSITITDTNTSCQSATVNSTISNNPTGPAIIEANTANTGCITPDGILEITSVDGGAASSGTHEVNWSIGTVAKATPDQANSLSYTGLSAGSYTVEVIEIASGCTSTATYSVIDNFLLPTITAAVPSDPTTINGSDGQIALTFTNVPNGTYSLTYVDENAAGQTFTNININSGSAIITGLFAGVYNDISITIGACTSVDNIDITLSDPSGPIIIEDVTVTNNTSCNNPNGIIEVVLISPGVVSDYNYELYDGSGSTLISSNHPFTNLQAGSFMVKAINPADNNQSELVSATIIDVSPQISASIGGSSVICEGEAVNIPIAITGGTGPYEIVGTGEIGSVSSVNNGDNITINPISSTAYELVSITDSNGCTGNVSGLFNAVVNTIPEVAEITGSNTACVNAIVQLSTVAMGTTLVWSSSQTSIATISPNGLVTTLLPGTTDITYEVSNGTCSVVSEAFTFVVSDGPSGSGIINSAKGTTFCPTDFGVEFSVDIQGAESYQWTFPENVRDNTSSFITATNSITVDFINVVSGTGQVQVVASNGCGELTSSILDININPVPEVSISVGERRFSRSPISFGFSSNFTPNSVTWDFGNGNSSSSNTPEFVYPAPGRYVVSVTLEDGGGCSAYAELEIEVVPPALLSIKNAITPNGDGKNDQLFIEGVLDYINTEVTLFDRYGNEIITLKNYQNDWDLNVNGKLIPAGNYLCVVKIEELDIVESRIITVVK